VRADLIAYVEACWNSFVAEGANPHGQLTAQQIHVIYGPGGKQTLSLFDLASLLGMTLTPGQPTAPPTEAEPFYAIRRLDGDLIYGEYAWMGADGPEDYTVPESDDSEGEYEIVLMRPVRVSARRYRSTLCDNCAGETATDDDEECPACKGTGEQERWVTL